MARKKPPDKEALKRVNDRYLDYTTIYKSVKVPLKSIVRNKSYIHKINKMVANFNILRIHCFHFLKLFILEKYHNNKKIPVLDKNLIVLVFKTIGVSDGRGRSFKETPLMADLKKFHKDVYSKIMSESSDISYTGLTQLIEYEAINILTCYHNHLMLHLEDFINRIVNVYFDKKDKVAEFIETGKKNELNIFLDELKILKSDIINNKNNSGSKFNNFKKIFDKEVIGDYVLDKSLKHVIENDPISLLPVAIRLSIYSEKLLKSKLPVEEKNKNIPIINVFPLAKSNIPGYIDLDSKIVAINLTGKKSTEYTLNISKNFDEIWGEVFKINCNAFQKSGYKFARNISTDGTGCSILFIREDKYNPLKKMMVRQIKKPSCYNEFEYIEYLDDESKKNISKMNIIGIDPGKEDLIFASDDKIVNIEKNNGKVYRKTKIVRYSQKQRDHELKTDIYKDKKLNFKRDNKVKLGNKSLSIEELESYLSGYNSGSCLLGNVYRYITLKNLINSITRKHYCSDIYRKLKWYSFINEQKSESNLIKRFTETYGDPKNTCLIFGDFSENGNYMKGFKSSKGIGMKRVFRRAGYTVHMVNEAYTSKYLYKDGRELVRCRNQRTPLALEMLTDNKMDLENPASNIDSWKKQSPEIIKRDLNGALNILFKGKCLIYGKKLPKYLLFKKKDVNINENNNNVNVKVIKNGKIKLKPKTPLSNR